MKVSKSHEDYLEAIVELGGSTEQAVRSVDIAKKMGVSKASVNKALSLLKEKGFLDQPYYGDATLTPLAMNMAARSSNATTSLLPSWRRSLVFLPTWPRKKPM